MPHGKMFPGSERYTCALHRKEFPFIMAPIDPAPVSCYCVNFRRAAATLTRHYDKTFASINLTTNQFFLIKYIALLGRCNKSQLAQYTQLERTTIIRNLETLKKKGLVEEVPGENRRNNLIQLTEAGERARSQGMPLWEGLQRETEQVLGEGNLPALDQMFTSLDSLA